MTEIGLLKLAHLLCLVYWLGADFAVFFSSYVVSDDRLGSETRVTVARLLFALDQLPRICMTLILPTGVHLGWRLGVLQVPDIVVVGTWLVCLAWLAMVVTLHVRKGDNTLLQKTDFGFRVAMIVGLLAFAGQTAADQGVLNWLMLKLVIYALLIVCGLAIRLQLRPFGPAFAAVAGGETTTAHNETIRRTFARTRPFVVTIWIGLLINTALGLHLF